MKSLLRIMLVLSAFAIIGFMNNYEHTYTKDGTIIDRSGQLITIEDEQGLIWTYVEKDNKGHKGDIVRLKLNDNMTDSNLRDDRIVNIKII